LFEKTFDFLHGKITGIATVFDVTNEQTIFNHARAINNANFNVPLAGLNERNFRFGLGYSF
jgi:hypothetical protein